MDKVFIAFGFTERDRTIVRDIETVLWSYGIRPDGGEYLGGESLDAGIKAKIKDCDGLIAIVTRRNSEQHEQTYSTWVHTEFVTANALGKPAIAFLEEGLAMPAGLFSQNERINFDPEKPLPAFLKLVRTIGEWKRESGRQLKVILLPDEISQLVRVNRESSRCEYRFVRDGEIEGQWREARISPEVGATLAYLRGVQDDMLLELKIQVKGQTWVSAYSQQWTHVRLEKEA